MGNPKNPFSRRNLSWNWTRAPVWQPFSGRPRRLRLPAPPGSRPRSRPGKAQREHERRADARAARLHLVGLSNVGVIIMAVVLGAAVALLAVLIVIYR